MRVGAVAEACRNPEWMAVRGQGWFRAVEVAVVTIAQDFGGGDSMEFLQGFGIFGGDDGGLLVAKEEACSVCEELGAESSTRLGGEKGADEV